MAKKSVPVFLAILLVSSAPSFAAETLVTEPASGVSSATQLETGVGSPLDRFYVNYFGIYHGASLQDASSSYTVDRFGNPSHRAVNFDSELTTAYMITPSIGVGPDLPFVLTPVMGQGFAIGDAGIKAFDKNLVNYRGFNLYANLYLQAPTSQYSRSRNMTFAVKSTPAVRYSFPHSRFTVGSWSEIKSYLGVTADAAFKLYAAPYVNYRLTQTLSLNLEYEMEAHHNVGTSAFDFAMYQTDLQPGFVWNITPKVLLNPYVQLFTGNSASPDTAAMGAVISATLL